MKVDGKDLLKVLGIVVAAGASGFTTSYLKAQTTKAEIAGVVNPALTHSEAVDARLKRKEEDDDRRFQLLHRRLVQLEDKFINPMVGASTVRRAYDAANMAAPQGPIFVEPSLQRIEVRK